MLRLLLIVSILISYTEKELLMSDYQLKTPVAFIIFNRPDTTKRVFAEIAKAKPPKLLVITKFFDSPLYVFCDGPNSKKDISLIQETRELIRSYAMDNAITNEKIN